MNSTVLISLLSMGGIGGAFSVVVLAMASKNCYRSRPRIEEINKVLPGANCGACGQAGCFNVAEAIASGELPVDFVLLG